MQIDGRTRLFLLLGNPVAHSLSPAMHNAGFRELGINAVYLAALVQPEKVGESVAALRALNAGGANVTSPCKEEVTAYLDEVSAAGLAAEAVNTIVNRDGLLFGDNTDGSGVLRALAELEESFPVDGGKVAIVGLGGAARAAAFSLAAAGAGSLTLVNRSADKCRYWADKLKKSFPHLAVEKASLKQAELAQVIDNNDLVIYSLPLDIEPFCRALQSISTIAPEKVLLDFRYHPTSTAIMEAFNAAGGYSTNGLTMLYHQAIEAFELFTGDRAPAGAMRRAMESTASQKTREDDYGNL